MNQEAENINKPSVIDDVESPDTPFLGESYAVVNGVLYFDGSCETCRPFCGALCCRAYGFVGLTEEEALSGRYAYKEATEGCNCDTCSKMRKLNIQYILLKQPDGSCFYLDGIRKCSIYHERPLTCKNYSCANLPFIPGPAS